VIDKILFEHELFAHQRFLMQMSVGTMPHAQIMHSIELLGDVVAPAVRKALADAHSVAGRAETAGAQPR
jgi:hypothetical protein